MSILNRHLSRFLTFLVVFVISVSPVLSQNVGHVQINGKIRKDNRPAGGVTIQITCPGTAAQTVTSKDNGTFNVSLDFQKAYTVSFVKQGLVSKVVEFNTNVPASELDIIIQNEFNIDLFDDVAGMSQSSAMNKPVAKFSYSPTYQDFIYDSNYSKQIKSEQESARKDAEELARLQERARLDSLNKIWNDSLVKVKEKESKLLANQAEQDRIRKEQEKARQDSIARAQAAASASALAAAQERSRQDSIQQAESKKQALAASLEKARLDSISKADTEFARQKLIADARDKARQDSVLKAQAEQERQDSLAQLRADAAAKAKAESEAKELTKARQDSAKKALADQAAREKATQDSIVFAKAEAERERLRSETEAKKAEQARLDSISKAQMAEKAKQKAEADALAKAEQAKQDSISKAQLAEKAKQKAEADALAKAEQDKLDREKARKDSLALIAQKENDRRKAIADSISLANDQAKALAKANEQSRLDSIKKAEIDAQAKILADAKTREEEAAKKKAAEEEARQTALKAKADQDAQQKADAERLKKEEDAKQKLAAEQKAKAEKDRLAQLAAEKATQDSIKNSARLQQEKLDEELRLKALADIEEKKRMLAKAGETDEKAKPAAKPTTVVPKIVDSDYREGLTEETINESNRIIYRTVVKIEGAAHNYQKIVYNWGGVYYFKNENNITQSLFEQELKNAKTTLAK